MKQLYPVKCSNCGIVVAWYDTKPFVDEMRHCGNCVWVKSAPHALDDELAEREAASWREQNRRRDARHDLSNIEP